MQQKTYYIPSYNALLFCHSENGGVLTLSGLNKYFLDTETDNSRQSVNKDIFIKLDPVEIKPDNLPEYKFLEIDKNSNDYVVKDYKVKFYLEEATALPAAPFKKTEIINSKILKSNKTGGQASLF
jgi:hypothetical protein